MTLRLTHVDDYQSWRIDVDGGDGVASGAVFIDPWLVDDMTFAAGGWLFHRRHEAPVAASVDELRASAAVVYTSAYSDHLHRPTLARLDKGHPIFAASTAARALSRLGFTRVTVLRPGAVHAPVAGLRLRAVRPAFPFTFSAVGLCIEADGPAGVVRVVHETHVVDAARLTALGPVDALVAPVEGVRLFGVPLAMSPSRVAGLVRGGGVRRVVPTGVDPRRSTGVVPGLLWHTDVDADAFADDVARTGARYTPLAAGETLTLGGP